MSGYRPQSYRRKKDKRLRWLYAIFFVLLVVTLKMRMQSRGIGPSTIFGREETPATSTRNDTDLEDDSLDAQLRLLSESDVRYVQESLSEPSPKPAREQTPEKPARSAAAEWLQPYAQTNASEHSPESDALVAEVIAGLKKKPADVIAARDRLNGMLSEPMSAKQTAFVKRTLTELAEKWLFSKTVCAGDEVCSNYKVKPGDNLGAIGKKCKVPYQLIMRINDITNPKSLRAGETIKVVNGPFNVVVSRSTFTMDLYIQNTYVRSFQVGLGRSEHQTPCGRWCVKSGGKLISPLWRDPDTGKNYQAEDPDYPLGSRWIALEGLEGEAKGRTGFAIHGTRNPEEIGRRSSRGCIRVRDDEVKLVYDLLVPKLSEVIVVD